MRLRLFFVTATLVAAVLVLRPSAQTGLAFVPGEILVKFAPAANANARAQAHRSGGGTPQLEITRTRVQRIRVAAGDENGAMARYRRNPNVLYAEPNFVRHIPTPLAHGSGFQVVPYDYYFDEQWGLDNTGQSFQCIPGVFGEICLSQGTPDADVDAPEAWAVSRGSSSVSVAIIDSGVDYTHPDLAPNFAGGEDFIFLDGDPMDDHGHGTHVAGIIAAAFDNLTGIPGVAEGVSGVAPQARFLAYKACRADGTCDDFAVQQAIARAVADGAKVINLSLGDAAYSQSLDEAVQAAWEAGVVIVAGAGNDGNVAPFYPAALDNVVSVAAFDQNHARPSFSNYGSWVDLSAPGSTIMSTYPTAACGTSTAPGDVGCYAWMSGTSMATPHVAGAAALVWSRTDVATNGQVVDILLNSADRTGAAPQPLDAWTSHGGLNLHEAITRDLTTTPKSQISVTASTGQAHEAGLEAGVFTIARTGDTSAPLTVHYSIGGTADPGADYVPLPATASIPSGLASTTVVVTPIDDSTAEGTESVVVRVLGAEEYSVGSPAEAMVTLVSDDLPSDMVVTSVAASAGTGPALEVVVTDATRNQGSGGAQPSATGFYLSTNSSLGTGDTFLASRNVSALAPGGTDTQRTTLPIPAGTAPGTYYVLAKADWDGMLDEAVETNNVRASASFKLGPDLVVSALAIPSSAAAGSTFSVTDTTKNQGGGHAVASITRFFLSLNSSFDGADVPLGTRGVPALAGGASSAATTALTVPANTAGGTYYVIARADADAAMLELSEANNTRSDSGLRVGPDLVVSSISVPAGAAAGAAVTVTHTVKNQGNGPAPASTARLYFSSDIAFDPDDQLLGSRSVPLLGASQTSTASTQVVIPADTETGNYYLIGVADAAAVVAESIETNNTRNSSVLRVGPDIDVTSIIAPSSAVTGTTIAASDTTKNQGYGTAAPSTTAYYFSSNGTLDALDARLATRAVPQLGAGTSESGSVTVTIPGSVSAGTYYIIAKGDDANAVVEWQETNNTRIRLITITAK